MRVNVGLRTEAQARESFRVPRAIDENCCREKERDARVGNR